MRNADFISRLLGAGGVVWFYLYKALLPVDLAFVYRQWHIENTNPLWWLPVAAALALTVALWMCRKSWSRSLLFAWVFFCAALAPVMGFADVGFMKYSLVADHYQHIAIIAVIALAASFWDLWRRRSLGGKISARNRSGRHGRRGVSYVSYLLAIWNLPRRRFALLGGAGKKSGLLDGPQ